MGTSRLRARLRHFGSKKGKCAPMNPNYAVFALAVIAALFCVGSLAAALWVESILDPFNRGKNEK